VANSHKSDNWSHRLTDLHGRDLGCACFQSGSVIEMLKGASVTKVVMICLNLGNLTTSRVDYRHRYLSFSSSRSG
jgi:hypothetical protein